MLCSIWSFLPSVSCTWSSKCCVLSGLFYLLSHVPGDVNAVFYLVFSTSCLVYVAGAVNAVFYLVFSTFCLMYLEQ